MNAAEARELVQIRMPLEPAPPNWQLCADDIEILQDVVSHNAHLCRERILGVNFSQQRGSVWVGI
jgi:hypothetical protein